MPKTAYKNIFAINIEKKRDFSILQNGISPLPNNANEFFSGIP